MQSLIKPQKYYKNIIKLANIRLYASINKAKNNSRSRFVNFIFDKKTIKSKNLLNNSKIISIAVLIKIQRKANSNKLVKTTLHCTKHKIICIKKV